MHIHIVYDHVSLRNIFILEFLHPNAYFWEEIMFLRSMAAVAAIVLAFPANAEEVVLRGASAFGLQTIFSRDFVAFTDWVNEHGKGKIQIQIIGGPEAVPTFELGNAVQSGVVDIANNTSASRS